MTSLKRLIVNADELGLTPGVNRGIVEAHHNGIVSSTTLMVNQPAASDVAAIAREHPNLGIGLQLALTAGRPTLPASQVPSLVDADGALPASPEGLLKAQLKDVLAEVRGQLRRFRELLGREPTHIDSQYHVHRQPVVLQALVTLSWETGLPVRSLSPEMRTRFQRERIATPEHFVEEFIGSRATLEDLVRILGALPVATTELACHPGFDDDTLRRVSRYTEPREREHAALVHVEARQVIQATGIRLIHYGQL
jgi:predicted glycoside hydrolase/deacetylase ChbG (UPF0249 family)